MKLWILTIPCVRFESKQITNTDDSGSSFLKRSQGPCQRRGVCPLLPPTLKHVNAKALPNPPPGYKPATGRQTALPCKYHGSETRCERVICEFDCSFWIRSAAIRTSRFPVPDVCQDNGARGPPNLHPGGAVPTTRFAPARWTGGSVNFPANSIPGAHETRGLQLQAVIVALCRIALAPRSPVGHYDEGVRSGALWHPPHGGGFKGDTGTWTSKLAKYSRDVKCK